MIQAVTVPVVALLVGSTALWYAVSLRAIVRQLRSPQVAAMTGKQRTAYMQSAEYLKLRKALRAPIYAATLLMGAMLLLRQLGL